MTTPTVKPEKKPAGRFHHGNLEEAVREAAFRAIESEGDLSIRALARSLGVSDAAIYRHFPNRDAVLGAVGAHGMTQLMTHIADAAEVAPNVRSALLAAGGAYVRYAHQHRSWFRLYFSRGFFERYGVDDGGASAARAESLLKTCLGELVPADRIDDAYRALWGITHGLSTLVCERTFQRVQTDDERIAAADAALTVFVDALLAQA